MSRAAAGDGGDGGEGGGDGSDDGGGGGGDSGKGGGDGDGWGEVVVVSYSLRKKEVTVKDGRLGVAGKRLGAGATYHLCPHSMRWGPLSRKTARPWTKLLSISMMAKAGGLEIARVLAF